VIDERTTMNMLLSSTSCSRFIRNASVLQLNVQRRCLAKKSGGKSKKLSANEEPAMTYVEMKAAAKEKRRQMWDDRRANQSRRRAHRRNRKRGTKKAEFQAFFGPFEEEYDALNRKGVQWNIRVGAVLERLPIVTPDEPEWGLEYEKLRRYLDNWGPEFPEGNPFYELWSETDPNETIEDALKLLPKKFKPAPRETEADATGNINTLDRALKQRVYLTVKESDESGDSWAFPSTDVREGETLLDAVTRSIKEATGPELEIYTLSNAPMAFDYRLLPTNNTEETLKGEKIFYFRITYDGGDVKDPSKCAWLTKEEIVKNALDKYGKDSHIPKLQHYHLSS